MRWNQYSSCTAGTAREFAIGKLHHYHCLVLEGGIHEGGSFHHIPIKDTAKLIEVFRRRVIKLFVDRGLLDPHFARKILSWEHSGFSVDISVPIPASSRKARVNLSQYIVRHPGNPDGLLAENPLRTFKRHNHLQDEIQYLLEREYQTLQSDRTK